jgi:ATP phosphoribosyltransferase-like protein
MVAVHSVVDADDVWQVLPELEEIGASGILVLPIQQMIP